ncbi:protein rarD [Intrasporangium oryzae NRRL B-24470]|uniref:Protein rarD n=1 Tax=Intrasporangium oryzae NRRL B-24470 TaxID=1386089 RepID=W9G4D8_9MICO|nr:EamA family transporter RarD [Intrasporangium oryzae]EWT00172.1 protein rarD [Intrasporangium oryzae NRRL B-24470]
MRTRQAGTLVLGAYVLWGFSPLYWLYLRPGSLVEIVAHRAIWSVAAAVAAVVVMRRLPQLRHLLLDRRLRWLLVLSGTALLVNWLVFMGAADRGEEVDISLGYFINPLLTVVIGRFVLREAVRPWQWWAFWGAAVGTVVLTVDARTLPVTGFGLALSWAAYGLVKKKAAVGAVESLAFETALMAPLALGYLVVIGARGEGHFTSAGPVHAVLLIGSGLVTILPLLLFSAGAPRMPMVALGPIQYVGPSIQFVIGVLFLHNEMTTGRWIGFGFIWASLAVFAADGIRTARAARSSVPTSSDREDAQPVETGAHQVRVG